MIRVVNAGRKVLGKIFSDDTVYAIKLFALAAGYSAVFGAVMMGLAYAVLHRMIPEDPSLLGFIGFCGGCSGAAMFAVLVLYAIALIEDRRAKDGSC